MDVNPGVQFIQGASLGVGIVFAVLMASTASVRAGEMWAEHNRLRATALASFAGISGIAALAAILVGIAWLIVPSPIAA